MGPCCSKGEEPTRENKRLNQCGQDHHHHHQQQREEHPREHSVEASTGSPSEGTDGVSSTLSPLSVAPHLLQPWQPENVEPMSSATTPQPQQEEGPHHQQTVATDVFAVERVSSVSNAGSADLAQPCDASHAASGENDEAAAPTPHDSASSTTTSKSSTTTSRDSLGAASVCTDFSAMSVSTSYSGELPRLHRPDGSSSPSTGKEIRAAAAAAMPTVSGELGACSTSSLSMDTSAQERDGFHRARGAPTQRPRSQSSGPLGNTNSIGSGAASEDTQAPVHAVVPPSAPDNNIPRRFVR